MIQIVRLAWRSIWRNRRRTVITIVSMALGLMLAIFFVAMADGIYSKLIDDAVRMLGGHITIEPVGYRDAPAIDLLVTDLDRWRQRINTFPEVERTKALILGQGVAKSANGAVGIALIGVEPSSEENSSPMAKKLIVGKYLQDSDQHEIFIGSGLAKQLKLGKKNEAARLLALLRTFGAFCGGLKMDWLQDEVQLRLAVSKKLVIATTNLQGELVEESLRVKGIFEVGSPEIDGYTAQIPIQVARRLYGIDPNAATQLGVLVPDPEKRVSIFKKLASLVKDGSVAVLPWEQVMPELSTYIQIDGGSNYVYQGILLFLILLTIFNTILMAVLERKREFMVLLALGTPPWILQCQVLLETVFIDLLGCAAGLLLGAIITTVAQVQGIDLSNFMEKGTSVSGFAFDPVIHPQLTGALIVIIGGVFFGATVLLGLYPMRQAVRVSIGDLMR